MSTTPKSIRAFFVFLFLLVSLLGYPQPAEAACTGIIYVRPTGNNTTGCSWTNAYTTLQSALNDGTLNSGDQIWVASGTYYPDEGTGQTNNNEASTFTMVSDVAVYGGFVGTPGTEGIFVRNSNPATNNTVLSGDIDQDGLDANNANTVVTITGLLSDSFVLDGFTITNGVEDSGSGLGGGIYIEDTSPTLTNLIISTNSANSNGGGVFVISNSSIEANYASPVFTDVTFTNNIAAR
jgi:hypothetical protein